MQRLHAGDHAEFAESWNVRGGNRLNVLDAWTAITRVIHFFRVLISIKSGAHAKFSDGMSEKLQAAFVEFCNSGTIFSGIPKQFAFQRWIVTIGLEHGGGVRFDDAVHH